MFEYGHLIYSEGDGWVFSKGDSSFKELKTVSITSSLNHLGKDGWELVIYEDKLGYILKKKVEKKKTTKKSNRA